MTSEPKFFEARDGVRLAWHETGEGAPICASTDRAMRRMKRSIIRPTCWCMILRI